MDKVPSVFATAMKSESSPVITLLVAGKAEGEEFMEIDDPDTAVCDNLVVRDCRKYKCGIYNVW